MIEEPSSGVEGFLSTVWAGEGQLYLLPVLHLEHMAVLCPMYVKSSGAVVRLFTTVRAGEGQLCPPLDLGRRAVCCPVLMQPKGRVVGLLSTVWAGKCKLDFSVPHLRHLAVLCPMDVKSGGAVVGLLLTVRAREGQLGP